MFRWYLSTKIEQSLSHSNDYTGEWNEIHLDRKSIFQKFIISGYNLLFRWYTLRWIIRIIWEKKEELRAIDNYRWPLPYILFILQDSCTFVSVEFANRYPDSLSISLCTHHLAVCCVSRPSSKGEESGREGEYTRVRACFSERVVDAAPRRRHLRPHRFVPVARNNRV